MNLLITGGAGFIGSNLIHQLIDRPEITRLVNLDCLTYAGHLANLEEPEAFNRLLLDHLATRPAVEAA